MSLAKGICSYGISTLYAESKTVLTVVDVHEKLL